MTRHRLAGLLLLTTLLAGGGGCIRNVHVPSDQRLTQYNDGPYRAVLAATVRDGKVDYQRLRREFTGPLDVYLDGVARLGPRTHPQAFPTPQHVLAYRINAFNALVLKTLLLHGAGSAASPKQLNPAWLVLDNWVVDGQRYDLHDLEYDLIRPQHDDWRLGFALVRGTLDSPPLLEEPYDGGRLDQQLDTQVRRWMSHPRVLTVDNGAVRMPSFFQDWQSRLKPIGGLAGLIERYLPADDPRRAPAIRAAVSGTIRFHPPDRRLNALER